MRQKNDLFDKVDLETMQSLDRFKDIVTEYIDNMSEEEQREMLRALHFELFEMNKITPGDWSATHPKGLACGGDKYYAKLTNDIGKKISNHLHDPQRYPMAELLEWSKTLTAYLEDFVSDTHIWDSFRNMYKSKYGKWLPFYDTDHDDYFTDDINIEDVKFLLWQCMARNGQRRDIFNSPYSPAVDVMAQDVFPILVDAVEKAPRATRVFDYLRKTFSNGDIRELREIGIWLVVRNPIFYDMYLNQHIEDEVEKTLASCPDLDKDFVRYATTMPYAWVDYFGPLGCKSSAYMAEIARCLGYDEIADKYSIIDSRDVMRYNVREITSDIVVAADAFGNEYIVERSSFDKNMSLDGLKAFMTSLMGVNGKWMINGIAWLNFDKPFTEELLHEGVTKEMVEKSPIAVAENRRIIQENDGCRVFGFKTLKDVVKFLGDKALIPVNSNDDNKEKSVVLLLSDTGTRNLVRDGLSIFKLRGNRHYSKKTCAQDGLIVPMLYTIDEDVAHYIAEHDLMPDLTFYTSQGGNLGHRTMQENMEFIIGFLRDHPTAPLPDFSDADFD